MPGTLGMTGFDDQTVRDIVFPSVGGNMIRLELTNAFGRSPLQVGRVTVALADLGAGVVPGTIHPVTFGGSVSVRIPAGAQVLSDPVGMQVSALQELAVSIYLPGRTGVATLHSQAQQLNWVSAAGDHAAEAGSGAFTIPTPSWYYLSGLDVRSSRAAGTVVAFGDSITDGVNSTVGGNDRWPNDLARRLDAVAGPTLSVADEGIGGNRLLTVFAVLRGQRAGALRPGRPGPARGPGRHRAGGNQRHRDQRGPAAFGRRAHPGPDHRRVPGPDRPGARPGCADIRRDPAAVPGRRLLLAGGEAIREAVNAWIRTSGAFDGVIDFDAVMRDPATRCGSTPPTTPAITCTPTTPGTRPWRTPSTWTCSCPTARAPPGRASPASRVCTRLAAQPP